MPNILIFQLKRFATTSVNTYGTYGAIARQEKITTPVDFPDELDLTSCVLTRPRRFPVLRPSLLLVPSFRCNLLVAFGLTYDAVAKTLRVDRYVKDGATDKSFIYDLYAVVNHSGGKSHARFLFGRLADRRAQLPLLLSRQFESCSCARSLLRLVTSHIYKLSYCSLWCVCNCSWL